MFVMLDVPSKLTVNIKRSLSKNETSLYHNSLTMNC